MLAYGHAALPILVGVGVRRAPPRVDGLLGARLEPLALLFELHLVGRGHRPAAQLFRRARLARLARLHMPPLAGLMMLLLASEVILTPRGAPPRCIAPRQ